MNFAHLHLHSHYSLLDGVSTVPKLVETAKNAGMTALALTDHGNMYGALELYRTCKKENMNPIIGVEAYLAPGSRHIKSGAKSSKQACTHLTLLAQNATGFKNLIKISSEAELTGKYYKPRADRELLETYNEGIICLSGCVSSEFSRAILDEKEDEAVEIAQWFHSIFGERYYIEIMNANLDIHTQQMEGAVHIANKLGMPLVATSDTHYANKEDAYIQDVGICVSTKRKLSDTDRMKIHTDELYLKSPEEMYAAFPGQAEAVSRTQEIADSVDIELDLGKRFFPKYEVPQQFNADQFLKEVCLSGIYERYDGNLDDGEVMVRLDRELAVIKKLGFAEYFLIVWDFVKHAREVGIRTNARGSGVGSIVCYALYISHACPLKHGLLFERFLDENRLEAPDIDVDVDKGRRGELIQYVTEKYGKESVAQIGTFGTLACRMAIKDVSRALSVPLDRVSEILDTIPDDLGITIDGALEQSEEFNSFYINDPQVKKVVDVAKRIEGNVRNTGTHAAAVVVSDGPLSDYVPLALAKDKESVVTQWEMNDVEAAGLLKIDFLGLRNLTMISDSIKMIEENHGVTIDVHHLPENDPETLALLQRGETKGVFQLESGGIRDLLIRMKPDRFEDIVAVAALYRPGPLGSGMVDDYVDVKNGKKRAKYAHPILEEILTETYGVIVYQEQVMQVLHRLGGIELSNAYKVIKAISKKKEEVISSNEEKFIEGATCQGVSNQKAAEIWNMILQFASYGFNKSHATAYAQVAYQTAYLKTHYPTCFMAALLTADIPGRNFTKRDSLLEHMDDCRRMGITMVPPDINHSLHGFYASNGEIVFGLGAIKSVGDEAIAAIVDNRTIKGQYKDLFEFARRVTPRRCGKAVIETLAMAGAFDSIHSCRASVFSNALQAVKGGKADIDADARGIAPLFDDEPEGEQDLPPAQPWEAKEQLFKERDVLGTFMSDHPLGDFREQIEMFSSVPTVAIDELNDRDEVMLAGMVSNVEQAHVKNAQPHAPTLYARFQLDDLYGGVECLMWPDTYRNLGYLLGEDRIIVITGYISTRGKMTNLIVNDAVPVESAAASHTSGIRVVLQQDRHGHDDILSLNDLLIKHPGTHPAYFTANGVTMVSKKHKVSLDNGLKSEIENLLGEGSCKVLVKPNVARIKREKSWD